MNFKKWNIFLLVAVCAASAFAILPTISNNIENPNLIVYFNNDEGYTMDCLWRYYSGEKRPSYQMDVDYGVEWIYAVDFARFVLSKFVDIKPGTLVLLLRWFHLVSWVGALVALWYFVGYHFGKGWQQIIAVLLLATRPAVGYMFNSLKPEPLVLLVMIGGFHFILRMIDQPRTKYLLLSVLCASIAFAIKFVGVFLLPAIIAAMCFAKQRQTNLGRKNEIAAFPKFKHNWILEFLIGIFSVALPFLFVFFYVRKSTGQTFYEELGVLKSFLKYKIAFLPFIIGIISLFISAVIFSLNKSKRYFMVKIRNKVNEINSYILHVAAVFFIFSLAIELRWIIFSPDIVRLTYAFTFFNFIGVFNAGQFLADNVFRSYLVILASKVQAFDVIILFLFAAYLSIEAYLRKRNLESKGPQYYKRLTFDIMLIPVFISLFNIGRFTLHHMLPFFVVTVILSIQGFDMLKSALNIKRIIKTALLSLFGILFALTVIMNGKGLIKSRISHYHKQREDIVFEIEKWWRANISLDAIVAAGHPTYVYVPPEYKNVKIFTENEKNIDKVEQLRWLVRSYNPRFVYYNNFLDDENRMPPIAKILPDKKVRLIKSFVDSKITYRDRKSEYKRTFFIYEILP